MPVTRSPHGPGLRSRGVMRNRTGFRIRWLIAALIVPAGGPLDGGGLAPAIGDGSTGDGKAPGTGGTIGSGGDRGTGRGLGNHGSCGTRRRTESQDDVSTRS